MIKATYLVYGLRSLAPASVPEPASWAMMVGGFGLVGSVMRRSRRAAHLRL